MIPLKMVVDRKYRSLRWIFTPTLPYCDSFTFLWLHPLVSRIFVGAEDRFFRSTRSLRTVPGENGNVYFMVDAVTKKADVVAARITMLQNFFPYKDSHVTTSMA